MTAGDGVEARPDATAPAAPPALILGRPLAVVIIAAEKTVSALGIWVLAVVALFIHHRAHRDPLSLLLWQEVGSSAHHAVIRWAVRHLPPLGPRLILTVAILLFIWGALLAAEGIGFWFELGWGELLIIVETVSLLPVEAWDLVRHPHLRNLAAPAINLLILWYVLRLYQRRFAARASGRPWLRAAFGPQSAAPYAPRPRASGPRRPTP